MSCRVSFCVCGRVVVIAAQLLAVHREAVFAGWSPPCARGRSKIGTSANFNQLPLSPILVLGPWRVRETSTTACPRPCYRTG